MHQHNRSVAQVSARTCQDKTRETAVPIQPKDGVLVLRGYGLRIGVERGHLLVSDGIGRARRSGRLHRATSGITRLVVVGHSGSISFDALRWLHDVGASFVQLDADGEVVVASGPAGLDDARLRRAQARATDTGVGTAIARDLLRSKLAGQAEVLAHIPESESAIAMVEDALEQLEGVGTPAQLRSVEAQAAAAYWSAWRPVSIRFAKRDQAKVPEHWKTFSTRSSPISGATRNAGNPINALLNYLYAILETEVRLAILTMGLDPGMGILHADLKSRDSFVFDVIEPLRPVVDGYLLTLLEERTFTAREFFETRQGVVRLMPPLPQALAEMAPRLAKLVAPVVEQVAERLSRGQGTTAPPFTVPTLLTQSNRSRARDRVRTAPVRVPRAQRIEAPAGCRECGVVLEDQSRHYCDECLPEYRETQVASYAEAGRAKLREMREAGIDPSHTGEASAKRSSRMQQRRREEAEWEAAHPDTEVDELVFTTEILPQLQDVSLSTMMRATGLSQQYCSLIRRGLKVPHRRHWTRLTEVGAVLKSNGTQI
jgi:CRISPR-associated endonuclease Cas1